MSAENEPAVIMKDVNFYYTDLPDDESAEAQPATEVNEVFADLSIELPTGMLSVVGENGIGKSTLMMLAAARLFPTKGIVHLFGEDTATFVQAHRNPDLEEQRNKLVSVIYQNMEFETNEPIGELMEMVAEMGTYRTDSGQLLSELQSILELGEVLGKRMQDLSKGQLQRAIIAFSLLYGSRMIVMDEPVFALEQPQKERAFDYLLDFSRRTDTTIYYSAHDLDLTKKYSDSMLLIQKNDPPLVGATSELYTRENLERAFQAPLDTLYRRDHLFREMLSNVSKRQA